MKSQASKAEKTPVSKAKDNLFFTFAFALLIGIIFSALSYYFGSLVFDEPDFRDCYPLLRINESMAEERMQEMRECETMNMANQEKFGINLSILALSVSLSALLSILVFRMPSEVSYGLLLGASFNTLSAALFSRSQSILVFFLVLAIFILIVAFIWKRRLAVK
ncbi:MAG TPA: hypothetical protein ENN46_02430 [Candidatus Woesearchaeota archaeon]|nr:hypothetical protein [Candidatus Woesearchaeota archaeon]